MDQNGMAEIKDFSRKGAKTPKTFTMDGDVFEMAPGIPLAKLAKVAKAAGSISATLVADGIDVDKAIASIVEVFAAFLKPASLELFAARLSDSENPIEMGQIGELLPWVLETYGMRPTKPSSGSSNGSPAADDSTSSTAGALAADAATGPNLLPVGLSTLLTDTSPSS